MARLGFVGLGVMGRPMAGHLLASGHEVAVCSSDPAKNATLAALGARVAADLADLAAGAEAVAVCVPRTEDVEAVVAGLRPGLAPGARIVDHSTIAPPAAARLHAALAAEGIGFVDAPITGGSMGAQAGTLTVFLGGDPADVDAVLPWLAAYSRRAERVGGPGAGQMMKMANQIAVGGALAGLCECLAFARRAGLDLAQAREMIGAGAGGSWAFENYGPRILSRDWTPGFSIDNQRKDFGYVFEAAESLGAEVPLTRLVDELLRVLDQAGRGGDTTAALFDVLAGDLPR